MKNTKLRIACLSVLATLLLLPAVGNAQNAKSALMYSSSRNPLMNAQNPAFFPSRSRIYVALPNFNVGFGSPVSANSLAYYDSIQDKTIINANRVLDTLTSDMFRLGLNVHAFGLGLNFNRLFFTFSAQAKAQINFGIPQGIATLLNEGNGNYLGDNVLELINGDFIKATLYAEAALGAGYRINDNLTVGLRLKGLVGYLDLSNAGSSLTLRTEEDYSAITANLDIDMNMALSGLDTLSTDISSEDLKKVKPLPKNYGFGLDLGARYYTDLFEVSASILDIGPGIHWKDGIHKVVSAHENNSITFTGADVSTYVHGGQIDTGFIQMLTDSVMSMIDYKIIDGGADYWTLVPTKVNLGGMFHVNEYFSAGLQFHGEFERGMVKVGEIYKSKLTGFYSNTSLVLRANLKDWIELIAAASVIQSKKNWDWFNPGVGLTFTPFHTLQMYLFLDYISAIPLVDAKQFNISFGLNLLVGRSFDN